MMHDKGFALITGACGGIGREMVRVFYEEGYRVIATDKAEPPEDLPYEHFLQPDLERTVLDEDHAGRVFDSIRGMLGRAGLKVLINNAAVQILGATDSLSREDWQATLNVNLLAPFIWSQALLPELEQAAGSIINLSSIHAKLTKRGFLAYATSKAALSGMTRAMAVDVGDRVRVNAIEPAAIATNMLKSGFKDREDLFQKLEQYHPTLRIGRPHEVARLALALCDGSLGFLHGACITLDGGIGSRLFDPDD